MRSVTLLLALAFAGLFACSSESEVLPIPPSEWIVVGNDLGLRNEFLDMANVVRLRDSSLTVFPLGSPNVSLDYPIVDSVLLGGDERWRMTRPNRDSIMFFDSLKNNNYYLRRLVDRDSLPDSLVVGRDFTYGFGKRDFFYGTDRNETSYLFERSPDSEQNCYLSRGYHSFDDVKTVSFGKDGYWRIDHRFRQPLLMYTSGSLNHSIMLVDSASMGGGVSGIVVNNNRPNGREIRQQFFPVDTSYDANLVGVMLDKMKTEGTVVQQFEIPKEMHRYRFSSSGRELREWRSINDFEIEGVRLSLNGSRYRFHTEEQTLHEGSFALHPSAPYLVLDGGCVDQNYLPISLAGTDTVVITVPLRIALTRSVLDVQSEYEARYPTGSRYLDTELELRIPTGL